MLDDAPHAAITLLLTTCGLSFITLFYLFQKHISGLSLLPYEPRHRVPWGAAVGLLAVVMPMLGVLSFLLGGDAEPAKSDLPDDYLLTGWGNFVFMMMFVVGVAAWLVSFCRADAKDLGLPTSWRQFAQDVRIGILATMAAFLPVYFIQLTLMYALQSRTAHPLVEQISDHQSPAMLILGFAMAVIAAPIFEEFTFRALLQGWLEKCEDESLAFDATRRAAPTGLASLDHDRADEIAPLLEPSPAGLPNPQVAPPLRPTRGWIPDLPHGWTPILISGTVFGLAHLGHGVAPVALVLFGIVLGYLYQRTHRLVPCITAHMLFNGYSMVQLWLQLQTSPAG